MLWRQSKVSIEYKACALLEIQSNIVEGLLIVAAVIQLSLQLISATKLIREITLHH